MKHGKLHPTATLRCCLQDKDSDDPSRVGGPENPLLSGGGGLTTVVGKDPNVRPHLFEASLHLRWCFCESSCTSMACVH